MALKFDHERKYGDFSEKNVPRRMRKRSRPRVSACPTERRLRPHRVDGGARVPLG
jgi:hypothetical protein